MKLVADARPHLGRTFASSVRPSSARPEDAASFRAPVDGFEQRDGGRARPEHRTDFVADRIEYRLAIGHANSDARRRATGSPDAFSAAATPRRLGFRFFGANAVGDVHRQAGDERRVPEIVVQRELVREPVVGAVRQWHPLDVSIDAPCSSTIRVGVCCSRATSGENTSNWLWPIRSDFRDLDRLQISAIDVQEPPSASLMNAAIGEFAMKASKRLSLSRNASREYRLVAFAERSLLRDDYRGSRALANRWASAGSR